MNNEKINNIEENTFEKDFGNEESFVENENKNDNLEDVKNKIEQIVNEAKKINSDILMIEKKDFSEFNKEELELVIKVAFNTIKNYERTLENINKTIDFSEPLKEQLDKEEKNNLTEEHNSEDSLPWQSFDDDEKFQGTKKSNLDEDKILINDTLKEFDKILENPQFEKIEGKKDEENIVENNFSYPESNDDKNKKIEVGFVEEDIVKEDESKEAFDNKKIDYYLKKFDKNVSEYMNEQLKDLLKVKEEMSLVSSEDENGIKKMVYQRVFKSDKYEEEEINKKIEEISVGAMEKLKELVEEEERASRGEFLVEIKEENGETRIFKNKKEMPGVYKKVDSIGNFLVCYKKNGGVNIVNPKNIEETEKSRSFSNFKVKNGLAMGYSEGWGYYLLNREGDVVYPINYFVPDKEYVVENGKIYAVKGSFFKEEVSINFVDIAVNITNFNNNKKRFFSKSDKKEKIENNSENKKDDQEEVSRWEGSEFEEEDDVENYEDDKIKEKNQKEIIKKAKKEYDLKIKEIEKKYKETKKEITKKFKEEEKNILQEFKKDKNKELKENKLTNIREDLHESFEKARKEKDIATEEALKILKV